MTCPVFFCLGSREDPNNRVALWIGWPGGSTTSTELPATVKESQLTRLENPSHVVMDGKEPRHGSGASILTAVTAPSQHYLGRDHAGGVTIIGLRLAPATRH